MPKKQFKKKTNKKFARKRGRTVTKRKGPRQDVLKYYHMKLPLPPRFLTTFTSTLTGILPAASIASNVFTVSANNLFLPWNAVGGGTAFPAPTTYATNALQPQGFGNLIYRVGAQPIQSGIYKTFKVYKSEILVTFNTFSSGDQLYYAVAPYSQYSTALLVPTKELPMVPDPFSKDTQANYTYKSMLRKKINIADVIGVSSKALQDDVSGYIQVHIWGPTSQVTWAVGYQTMDNAVTTSQVSYKVTVRWWAELYNPEFTSLIQI